MVSFPQQLYRNLRITIQDSIISGLSAALVLEYHLYNEAKSTAQSLTLFPPGRLVLLKRREIGFPDNEIRHSVREMPKSASFWFKVRQFEFNFRRIGMAAAAVLRNYSAVLNKLFAVDYSCVRSTYCFCCMAQKEDSKGRSGTSTGSAVNTTRIRS